jgi:hypothetical protein
MSYTTLYVFDKEGQIGQSFEFQNSRYATVIWRLLGKKYVPGYRNMFYDEDIRKVWDLTKDDPKLLSDTEWYSLICTYDNVVVPSELFETVAKAFENFEVPDNLIDHSKDYAKVLRNLIGTDASAVAWWVTSTTCDPWTYRDPDTDEATPYDLTTGEKHWFLKRRGEL